jgi:hypothetical protein
LLWPPPPVALPGSTLPQLTSPNDIVQVGSKGKGKGHGKSLGKAIRTTPIAATTTITTTITATITSTYHGRYWGHRYSYRPHGWQTMGCIAAGPIWYCP